jgi:hypothetical protein
VAVNSPESIEMIDNNAHPQKRTLSKANDDRLKDPPHIESQTPVRGSKGVMLRLCWPVFMIVPSLLDITWQCCIQYIQLQPISSPARYIRKTSQRWWMFVASENLFMVLVVAYNTFLMRSVWEGRLPFSINTPLIRAPRRRGLTRIFAYAHSLVFLVLVVAAITVPFWWRNIAWGHWRRSLWRDARCKGWDYLITMDTINYQQFGNYDTEIRSKASIWSNDDSNYTIQLEHTAPSRSILLVQTDDWNSMPYTVEYDFSELNYSSPTLSGTFTNFPVLSFPDLSLYSQFPNYTWNWECDAPGAVLSDGNQEIMRTTVGNYDDCTMLNVCGMGNIDRLVIPLGVILVEMEKSGLCCTSPFVYVHPRTELTHQKTVK